MPVREVDAVPIEAQDLATAHAGGRIQDARGEQAITTGDLEEGAQLLR